MSRRSEKIVYRASWRNFILANFLRGVFQQPRLIATVVRTHGEGRVLDDAVLQRNRDLGRGLSPTSTVSLSEVLSHC
jgi:hypothetical protein